MSNEKTVRIRDAVIVGAITLNFVFFRWRAAHAGDLPVRSITTLSEKDIIGDPSRELGEPGARYVLVEFGDYQCPPCAHLFPEIDKLLTQNRRNLRFQFRQYPLPGHPRAFRAAMLAESARRSGQFETVHQALYGLDANMTERDLRIIASANNLRYPLATAILTPDKEMEAEIVNDKLAANKVPVKGTPSLFLCTPDQRVLEVHTAAQIQDLIR